MKAVITVIGKDQKGIVYRVSEVLYKHGLNLEDISQTLMDDYFTMVALVNLEDMKGTFDELVKSYQDLGEEMDLSIRVQHEDLFNKMHQL